MSFHQEQIKKKLLQVQIDTFRKHQLQSIKIYKKTVQKPKKYPNSELSEWATNEKTMTYTSFPYLQFASQNIRKNKIMQNSPSKIIENIPNYMSSYLTKTNFKPKDKTSIPNPINLSFNPEQSKKYKTKNKKSSVLLQKDVLRSEQKKKKQSLQRYLINGQIRIQQCQKKQNQNTQNRSSHLLRLLRQRQILRRKRYSFDIDSGFMTKSYFNL